MKNITRITFLFIALLYTASTNAQVEQYFVRNQDLKIEYDYPEESAIYRKCIDRLDASKRVEIIGDANREAIATHLLEVEPFMSMSNDFKVSFTDSTLTMKAVFTYTTSGRVDMLVTDVRTGDFTGSLTTYSEGNSSKELILKYKDVGWAPKTKYEGEYKKALDAKLRKLVEKDLPGLEKQSRASMVINMNPNPAEKLFPYRLNVLEVAETDKDEAEKVIISGGTEADLVSRDRLVVYRIKEKTVGKKKFENFETIGRLKFVQDDEKGGMCVVLKGKKQILAAINAKEKIYCVSGFTPYTKKDKSNDLKVAIFINYPAGTPQKTKDAFYRRTRLNISNFKGIKVIEREMFNKIEAERALQKSEQFVDNAIVEQFKSLGADMVLEIDLKSNVDKYNMRTMVSKLNLIDVETNKIQGSKTITNSSTVERLNVYPSAFLKECLPPLISVVEITDEKKESADEVLVVGDFEYVAYNKIDVYRRRMIEVEGEMLPRFEKIGTVAQRTSEGEGIVNCKVKDGGKEIYAAIQSGDLLVCTAKAGFFEKMAEGSFKSLSKLYGM